MTEHRTEIEGYERSLQKLAQVVCRLRYDKVALFFGYCAIELMRQSNADMRCGRKKLACILTRVAGLMSATHRVTAEAFELCAPHMKSELTMRGIRVWRRRCTKMRW